MPPIFSRLLAAEILLTLSAFGAAPKAPPPSYPPVPREEIRAAVLSYFGPGPALADVPKPDLQIVSKTDAGDHERWRVRYNVEKDERIDGFLLVPKPLPAMGRRLPLVLCPHPTAEEGKDRAAGVYDTPPADALEAGRRSRGQYALELVRRGFLAFAPDRAGYGERRLLPQGKYQAQAAAYDQHLQRRYPGWRLTAGKNVWDLQRALDALLTLEFVDPKRIGTIGHSLGAWDSIMLIGVDARVTAAVVNSGGMIAFDAAMWRDPAVLRAFLADRTKHELRGMAALALMLAVPRPVLYIWSIHDTAFDKGRPGVMEGLREISAAYARASGDAKDPAKADLGIYYHPNGHDFPPEARALAGYWLEDRLSLFTP